MAARRSWTKDEIRRQVLALYPRTPSGRPNTSNAQIATLDAALPPKGMRNVSRLDCQVRAQFLADPQTSLPSCEQQLAWLHQAPESPHVAGLAEETAEEAAPPPAKAPSTWHGSAGARGRTSSAI